MRYNLIKYCKTGNGLKTLAIYDTLRCEKFTIQTNGNLPTAHRQRGKVYEIDGDALKQIQKEIHNYKGTTEYNYYVDQIERVVKSGNIKIKVRTDDDEGNQESNWLSLSTTGRANKECIQAVQELLNIISCADHYNKKGGN